ncbi:hypothetical protein [Acrocarpospora sp. B8E8]|uniref:hypothetical protein n=1 Tax=Acrocarpospora sp. B8E8 TaxID=3153572 RepID=UPI00325F917C
MTSPTPAQLGAAEAKRRRDARRTRYARLLAKGNAPELADELVGISPRTAARYDAQLREVAP